MEARKEKSDSVIRKLCTAFLGREKMPLHNELVEGDKRHSIARVKKEGLPEFCIAYAVLDVVGGCDVCQTRLGWGAMISLPKQGPFLIVCAKHARTLLSLLLSRFMEIRKGDPPEVILTDPFPREETEVSLVNDGVEEGAACD